MGGKRRRRTSRGTYRSSSPPIAHLKRFGGRCLRRVAAMAKASGQQCDTPPRRPAACIFRTEEASRLDLGQTPPAIRVAIGERRLGVDGRIRLIGIRETAKYLDVHDDAELLQEGQREQSALGRAGLFSGLPQLLAIPVGPTLRTSPQPLSTSGMVCLRLVSPAHLAASSCRLRHS